ncbi:MAG TPA: SMP-30/gluconolactonase/LRE family protein [Coxiellaceae bacterium]|nr:SMP-30/gluconolactonase/LRE family protein [Coxiellaceae bacterium]
MESSNLWPGRNTLGEGPLWDSRENVLYWVDIESWELHRFDPTINAHRVWPFESELCCIGLRKAGGLIAAFRNTIEIIYLPEGQTKLIAKPLQHEKNVMFNDGAVDFQGRFWVGTKDLKESNPMGALYCMQSDHSIKKMDSGFTVSNGIGWNPDQTIMYFTDSPARCIYAYEFDKNTGEISHRREWVKVPEKAGFPDGLTVDSEGFVWSTHWNGWRVTRYAPDGSIDQVISMPVPLVTSCCFGGENLSTLFITTASRGLSEQQLKEAPLSGGLFSVKTTTKGVLEPFFVEK